MESLILAIVAFVGSHFILSHPLRQPLLQALGRRGFQGVYSLIAGVTLIWVILAYSKAPVVFLWNPPAFFHLLTNILMLAALVLFLGSLVQPNPLLIGSARPHGEAALGPDPAAGSAGAGRVAGVVAITRHPMMWGIGLWAISHALVNGDAATLFLCLGIGTLALVGAALQDRRKAAEFGANWQGFAEATAFTPFAAQFRGRLPWRTVWPGWLVIVGGALLYVILLYFHEVLFGVSALLAR